MKIILAFLFCLPAFADQFWYSRMQQYDRDSKKMLAEVAKSMENRRIGQEFDQISRNLNVPQQPLEAIQQPNQQYVIHLREDQLKSLYYQWRIAVDSGYAMNVRDLDFGNLWHIYSYEIRQRIFDKIKYWKLETKAWE